VRNWKLWISSSLLFCIPCIAQNDNQNGYSVPKTGIGLTLRLGPGTCTNSSGVITTYPGGVVSVTSNKTTFGYIDSTCTIQTSTTAFAANSVPLFTAVAGLDTIQSITDSRTSYVIGGAAGSGTVTSSGSPVSGNIPKFTTATNIAPAVAADLIALWSGSCDATHFLRGDGACATAGTGTVTSVATTSPITGGTITTTGTIACATCVTSAAPLTNLAVVVGSGSQGSQTDTALSTDGAGAITDTTGNTAFTHTQGTITTSHPTISHTVTWNAGGVAFTNWLSNITCTAAATASIAAGFGTAGTQWQFKYAAANCASPQLLSPDGTIANPAYSFSGNTGTGFVRNANNSGTVLMSFGAFTPMGWAAGIGTIIPSNNGLYWANSTSLASAVTVDTALSRPAAGVIGVDTNAASNGLGTIRPGLYATTANCAATGTAANPSVASCSAAAAGSFSCATNASTGTCVVNTTAVTANSEVFVTQRTDTTTGTRLSVTCNTGVSTVLPVITAVTAATSFTINLGTITTNPECFSYYIIN